MTKMARALSIVIVEEFGPEELLRRLADPAWFQAFGCVLGFDWHSSGVTTTVCGALKEGLSGHEKDTGLYICGGKGGTSRRTPQEIMEYCGEADPDPADLVYASKMSARVDSAAVQDHYQLYHHNFFFLEDGTWCVVQQGMNDDDGTARRYHWLSDELQDFVEEPQNAVCSQAQPDHVLNLASRKSRKNREAAVELSGENPWDLLDEFTRMELPHRHYVSPSDIQPGRLKSTFLKTYQEDPADYEELLGIEGVGPKTVRALTMLAEIVYGEEPSFEDPARYSFAHGGKDGHPYPVDREMYDRNITFLEEMINQSDVEHSEKKKSLKKLAELK